MDDLQAAKSPTQLYHVDVPGNAEGDTEATSPKHALSRVLFREIGNKGYYQWGGQEYRGFNAVPALINAIVEDGYLHTCVTATPAAEEPKEAPKEVAPTKPQQLELDLQAVMLEEWHDAEAYRALVHGQYATDEWYELSVTWPATGRKMTYTADSAEEYARLIELLKKAWEQKASLQLRIHQRQRRTLRWEKYNEIAKQLIEKAKADPAVADLVSKVEAEDVAIMVSPYLKCGSGRYDEGPNQLRVGFCRPDEQAGIDTMYDALVHHLMYTLQRKTNPEQPKVWRVLQRPDQAAAIESTIKTFKDRGDSEDKIVKWLIDNYAKVGMTEDTAKQLVANASQVVAEFQAALITEDGVLWRKGKLSSKAIKQFRQFADGEVQRTVSGLLFRDKLKEALSFIRPYAAYRVQSLTQNQNLKTIAVDFDGVLAEYDPAHPEQLGNPKPGAIDALWMLADHGYRVVVLSSRALDREGKSHIEDWLDIAGAPHVLVTAEKIPAEIYVDDHAFKFTDWGQDLEKLLNTNKTAHFVCGADGSSPEWQEKEKQFICPACDKQISLLSTVVGTLYAFSPGDKVHVKALDGNTLGDAFIIHRASQKEAKALKAPFSH